MATKDARHVLALSSTTPHEVIESVSQIMNATKERPATLSQTT